MSRRNGKRYRILESGERARFLNQFNSDYRAPCRDRLACRLMLEAGLRVGEVVALRPEHVRWQTGRVVVREGKGSLDRRVFVSDDLRDALAEWVEEEGIDEDELIFQTRTGSQLEPNHLRRRVKRAARDAGLQEAERVTPHTLRHTFATHFLRRTGDLEKLRQLMGHSDISTTQIYLNYADEEIEESGKATANAMAGEFDAAVS